MTANQIKFAELREQQRHNRVSERHEHRDVNSRRLSAESAWETAQANSRNATTNWFSYLEQARANKAQESLKAQSQEETARHNVEMESQGRSTISEQVRHNFETEGINWFNATQTQRNAERQSSASLIQAENARDANDIRRSELSETIRRNSAWMNLEQANIGLGYAKIAQSDRALAETRRHNAVGETREGAYASQMVRETIRHNRAAESNEGTRATAAATSAKAAESTAASKAKLVGSEKVRNYSLAAGSVLNGIRGVVDIYGGIK